MYNNATFIDKEQLKNINKLDKWLVEEQTKIPEDVVLQCRELIIFKCGFTTKLTYAFLPKEYSGKMKRGIATGLH